MPKFKPGDTVVLKHDLEPVYMPEHTFPELRLLRCPVKTIHIRSHSGHRFKIIGIFDCEYVALCECGVQYQEGDKQFGFWFLVDDMLEEGIPLIEPKVGRFDSILGG